MNLTDVRTGLYERLRSTNPELNVYTYPDPQPEPPCVLIAWPTEIDYHGTVARCLTVITITLTVMVAAGDLAAATRTLDTYAWASDEALTTSLETAKYPAWSDVNVVRATNWREISELNVLAFDIELTIQA